MKKLVFAALAILIGCTTIPSCSSDKEKKDRKETAKSATQGEAFETATNIRYIDLDTILQHYEFATLTQSELEQLAREYQQLETSYGTQIQNRANQIQSKMQSNGYLSEESYRADEREFNTMQSNAQNALARKAQQTQTVIEQKNKAVYDSINNYIIRYNKDKKYDAILFRNAGIYFNPELDITAEVIEGLNTEYKGAKAPEAKPEEPKKK